MILGLQRIFLGWFGSSHLGLVNKSSQIVQYGEQYFMVEMESLNIKEKKHLYVKGIVLSSRNTIPMSLWMALCIYIFFSLWTPLRDCLKLLMELLFFLLSFHFFLLSELEGPYWMASVTENLEPQRPTERCNDGFFFGIFTVMG